MTNQDLILDIAVNLGRLGRFLMGNRSARARQFALETQSQLDQLSASQLPPSLSAPISKLPKLIDQMIHGKMLNSEGAEDCFTWASILTHRAKLA